MKDDSMADDTRGGSLLPTRGTVWKIPYSAHERLVLSTQARFDFRYIPLVWYWVLLRPEDEPGGTTQHDVLWESPRVHRRYMSPIPVHLFIDPTGQTKGMKKGVVERDGTVEIGFSRQEGRRIGERLLVADEPEGTIITEGFADPEVDLADGDVFVLLPDEPPNDGRERKLDYLFIPRPGDVFRFRGKDHEIAQLNEEFLGASEFLTKWTGTATLVREDSTAPRANRKEPPTEVPPVRKPKELPWRK